MRLPPWQCEVELRAFRAAHQMAEHQQERERVGEKTLRDNEAL